MDDSQSPAKTQTQTKELLKDIFDSDDDEPKVAKKSAAAGNESDDDIFADSDDDGKPAKGKAPQNNMEDSDDDNYVVPRVVQRIKKGKGPASKILKRKVRVAPVEKANSGDEYDSGEEVVATKGDRDFIADDDDHADLMKEYDGDNTKFYDEGPDDYEPSRKKKKGSAGPAGPHLSSGINLRDQDPLSQTLAGMKSVKSKQQSDVEKEVMVDKLQKMMVKAVKADNECVKAQQPAIHKMQMLEKVKTVLSMRPLQNVLMDRNILFNIRDWIEPKDAHTLPAMSIRTAMYELLLQLPCTPEYLKRSDGEKAPIGVTIVALRKHKMETPANKRLLKELMDKWSRPIFSKSTDVRLAAAADHHSEVQQAVVQKYAKAVSSSGADGVQEVFGAGGGFKQIDDAAENEDGDGTKKKVKGDEARMRARTPFNQGFLYTVQPQSRKVDKSNIMERSLGQGRMKLFKTTSEGVMGKGKGLGKKENPRAMDTAVSRL